MTSPPVTGPDPGPGPVAAVMVHVADVAAALDWYARAFPAARRVRIEAPAFECLALGALQIELVPADAKVGSGACGSVVYWSVPAFEPALARWLALGARLHRGPMDIEGGARMAQVLDPWGNPLGLRGPGVAA